MRGEELCRELRDYDGRSQTILSEVANRHRGEADFLSRLVGLALDDEPVLSVGATWILKAELAQGAVLAQKDADRLVRGLERIGAWQAQLHVCQSIVHMTVHTELAPVMESWLTSLLDTPRPFLRAWASDALCRLRGASPQTAALLERMELDDAASVRARVRNLKREFGAGSPSAS